MRAPRDLFDFAVTPPLQQQPQYFPITRHDPPLTMKRQRLLRCCPSTAEQSSARHRYRIPGNVLPSRRSSATYKRYSPQQPKIPGSSIPERVGPSVPAHQYPRSLLLPTSGPCQGPARSTRSRPPRQHRGIGRAWQTRPVGTPPRHPRRRSPGTWCAICVSLSKASTPQPRKGWQCSGCSPSMPNSNENSSSPIPATDCARRRTGGRRPKRTRDQAGHAHHLYDGGGHTVQRIADLLQIPRSTIYGHLTNESIGRRPTLAL